MEETTATQTTPAITSQKCTKCKIVKNIDQFNKDSSRKSGYSYTCRLCSSAKNKKGAEKHKEQNKTQPPVIESKKCSDCGNIKPASEFHIHNARKSGLSPKCKECQSKFSSSDVELAKRRVRDSLNRQKPEVKAKNAEYHKEYYLRPDVHEKYRQYRNSDEVRQRMKEWSQEPEVILKRRLTHEIRKMRPEYENRRILRNTHQRERYKTDINYKMGCVLRKKLNKLLNGYNTSFYKLLGCSLEFFKDWMEFRFDENMTWENHGTYWEIDHVLPVSRFDFTNVLDMNVCWRWTNLQPLKKEENLSKSNKIMLSYYLENAKNVYCFDQKYNNQFLGYQALDESLTWLRDLELKYGNNASYEMYEYLSEYKNIEMDNPQPSL